WGARPVFGGLASDFGSVVTEARWRVGRAAGRRTAGELAAWWGRPAASWAPFLQAGGSGVAERAPRGTVAGDMRPGDGRAAFAAVGRPLGVRRNTDADRGLCGGGWPGRSAGAAAGGPGSAAVPGGAGAGGVHHRRGRERGGGVRRGCGACAGGLPLADRVRGGAAVPRRAAEGGRTRTRPGCGRRGVPGGSVGAGAALAGRADRGAVAARGGCRRGSGGAPVRG